MSNSHRTSRRGFLKRATVAGAAGILLPSANRAFGYKSENDRPVFATIGLRNQGWAITAKSFQFADFAALADVDANVLGTNAEQTEKKQGKKPDAYKDYRKILDRDDRRRRDDRDARSLAHKDRGRSDACRQRRVL